MKKRIGDIIWVIFGLIVIFCYLYQMKWEHWRVIIAFIIAAITLAFWIKLVMGTEGTRAKKISSENNSPPLEEKSNEEVICAEPSKVSSPPEPSVSRHTGFNIHIGGFFDLSIGRHRITKK